MAAVCSHLEVDFPSPAGYFTNYTVINFARRSPRPISKPLDTQPASKPPANKPAIAPKPAKLKRLVSAPLESKSADNTAGKPVAPSVPNKSISLNGKSISFRYIPILASVKEFGSMDIQILKVSSYARLQELVTDYSMLSKKAILKKYVKPAGCVWHWESDTTFRKYDTDVSKEVERAYQSGNVFQVTIDRFRYEIDPGRMKQINLDTKKERRIDRRPKRRISIKAAAIDGILEMLKTHIYRIEHKVPLVKSHPGILEHLLKIARPDFVTAERVPGVEHAIQLKGMESVVKGVKAQLDHEIVQWLLVSEKLSYPSHWEHQDSNCVLKEVKEGTGEWTQVKQHMMTEPGFPAMIIRIERIQNRWLCDAYQQSRKRMADKNNGQVNEKVLFHGTSSTPPIKIYNSEQGFDNRLASPTLLWGAGSYFAAKAKYSNHYAFTTLEGHKQILLVKVLTGITCTYRNADRTLKVPPIIPNPSSRGLVFDNQRFDSVSGYTNDSEVYVIYEPGRMYPEYLITYQ
jgi:hypothetical protein